jgi:hypothetical protein
MEGGFKCRSKETMTMGSREQVALSLSKIRRCPRLSRENACLGPLGAGPMEIVPVPGPTSTLQPCVAGAGEPEMPRRNQGVHTFSAVKSRKLGPPSQLEIVLFWIVGLVTTVISGGVAIYASHYHLWN